MLDTETVLLCTPTHQSALIADSVAIFSLYNINTVDYTYLKTTVDLIKEEGVKWIFVDEVSMISSKVWSVIIDIKFI